LWLLAAGLKAMHERDEIDSLDTKRLQPPWRLLSLGLVGMALLLIVLGFVGWQVYNFIFGFGGPYTMRFLPPPEHVIDVSLLPPGDDFSIGKRNGVYKVQQPLNKLVEFYQQAIPRTGWTILKQGAFRFSTGDPAYCFIVEQQSDVRTL
jgi:hypothetical protein